jgi:hypothetical protein
MKTKKPRNKKYTPAVSKLVSINQCYILRETALKIRDIVATYKLTAVPYNDRFYGRVNDFTLLVWLHQHTFLINALLRDETHNIHRLSNDIRHIIEKWYEKLAKETTNEGIPDYISIGQIGANKVIAYINASNHVLHNIDIKRYKHAVSTCNLNHRIYCQLNPSLVINEFIEIDNAEKSYEILKQWEEA